MLASRRFRFLSVVCSLVAALLPGARVGACYCLGESAGCEGRVSRSGCCQACDGCLPKGPVDVHCCLTGSERSRCPCAEVWDVPRHQVPLAGGGKPPPELAIHDGTQVELGLPPSSLSAAALDSCQRALARPVRILYGVWRN